MIVSNSTVLYLYLAKSVQFLRATIYTKACIDALRDYILTVHLRIGTVRSLRKNR